MSVAPAFPGMNPYLESPTRWPEIHTWLIVEIARSLNPQLRPKYRAAVETRVYIDDNLIGIPDATVYRQPIVASAGNLSVSTTAKPERVTLPVAYEVTERYLEIRNVETKRVITVIELLSPANKRKGEGRRQYLAKRRRVLNSSSHFIEIDLLRMGEAMPVMGAPIKTYQVLVSRSAERPSAERYSFGLREQIPQFAIPLSEGDDEPVVNLNQLLANVCSATDIESTINYTAQPQPPLSIEDFEWIKALLS
ncbi:MAG: DUF4058 family protein [Cyanobacteria bacterium P01_D01_bin.1]